MNARLYCLMICIGTTGSTGPSHSMQPGSGVGLLTSLLQDMPENHRRILKDLSLPLQLTLLKDFHPKLNNGRREFLQSLVLPNSRRYGQNEAEEKVMKMKLFRLMYETVRENDTKVKRAEVIERSYKNSTHFEIGYLLGDIDDKLKLMWDIKNTLDTLYDEWKPIEHINAYEQLSNIAIELNHIVDMVTAVDNRTTTP